MFQHKCNLPSFLFLFFLATAHGLWNLSSHIIMFFLTKNKNQCLCRYLNIFLLLLLLSRETISEEWWKVKDSVWFCHSLSWWILPQPSLKFSAHVCFLGPQSVFHSIMYETVGVLFSNTWESILSWYRVWMWPNVNTKSFCLTYTCLLYWTVNSLEAGPTFYFS